MIEVKIVPLGEEVKTVALEEGSTVSHAVSVAGKSINGRSIRVNNAPANEDTVLNENSTITLANQAKGGSK